MSGIKNVSLADKTTTTISSPLPNVKNATTRYNDCAVPNQAPQVNDIRISFDWNSTYQFKQSDILDNFFDSNPPLSIKILEVPAKGSLKLNGSPVIDQQLIYFTDVINLTYTPAQGGYGSYYSSFKIQVNDDGIAPNPFSTISLVIFDVIANTPPNVEDRNVCMINDQTYTFSQQDFTVGYQDDQNDIPYQVKIETLPDLGSLKLDSIQVQVGQTFDIAQAQLLTYTPVSTGFGLPYTSFNFSVNDQGSQTFSQVRAVIIAVNSRPVLSGKIVSVDQDQPFIFSPEFFEQLTTDADGDGVSLVKIMSLPNNGQLVYKGVAVTLNQVVEVGSLDIFNLSFNPDPGEFGYQYASFNFQIRDNNPECPAWSVAALIRIDVKEQINQPPQITNSLSFNLCNSDTYSLKWNQFANEFIDPEGQPLQMVRIDSLPSNGQLKYSGVAVTEGQEFVEGEIGNVLYESTIVVEQVTFQWSGQDSAGQWSNSGLATITVDDCVIPAPGFKIISVGIGGCGARLSSGDFTTMYISDQDFVASGTIIYTDQLLTQRLDGANQSHRIKNEAGLLFQSAYVIDSVGQIISVDSCVIQVAYETILIAPGTCSSLSTDLIQTQAYYLASETLSVGTVIYTDSTLDTRYDGGDTSQRIETSDLILIEKEFIVGSDGQITSIDSCSTGNKVDGVLLVNNCDSTGGFNSLIQTTGTDIGDTVTQGTSLFLGNNQLYRMTYGGENRHYKPSDPTGMIISSFIVRIDNNGKITEKQTCTA